VCIVDIIIARTRGVIKDGTWHREQKRRKSSPHGNLIFDVVVAVIEMGLGNKVNSLRMSHIGAEL
jgi:hypothetical protein